MGKPAARIGDMHTCTLFEGTIAHVGGPIGPAGGSPNVNIGGMPAARKGDPAFCVGATETIKDGSSSVYINGQPAARMGDSTVHAGGQITVGCLTVNIG